MQNDVPAEILELSDGMVLFELTGDASFLTDDELARELGL